MAGDGAGIAGARAAVYRGRLAALGAVARLELISDQERDTLSEPQRLALTRDASVRPLLEALYRPPAAMLNPSDRVTVCRCEEVTAGDIRDAARRGCMGPNQAKALLRCGMGPCQGQNCGLSTTGILAAALNASPEEIGYFRIRPPIKPLRVEELATLETEADASGSR